MRKICKGWRTFMKNYEQHLTNEIEKLKEEIKKLKNKDNDVIKNTLWCNCNHNNKTYDINRLFNWNYTTLLELFHEFKKQKNEKIIWDEKYLLEFMEKKSKGMSSFQIAFGKDEKTPHNK